MNLDFYIFNFINQFALKWQWLDRVAIFFAVYLEYVLLFLLLVFLAVDYRKHWKMVTEALVAAVVTRFVITEIIRKIWFRPRPFVHDAVHLLLPNYDPKESSFPSGHASFYFALSTVIYCYNKKAGILFYIASFFIIISRVFVGIHWPSDILAGALLGVAIGLLIHKFFRRAWQTML